MVHMLPMRHGQWIYQNIKLINLKNRLIHVGNTFREYYIKSNNEVNKLVRNKKFAFFKIKVDFQR